MVKLPRSLHSLNSPSFPPVLTLSLAHPGAPAAASRCSFLLACCDSLLPSRARVFAIAAGLHRSPSGRLSKQYLQVSSVSVRTGVREEQIIHQFLEPPNYFMQHSYRLDQNLQRDLKGGTLQPMRDKDASLHRSSVLL
jgi:hypothetical protein